MDTYEEKALKLKVSQHEGNQKKLKLESELSKVSVVRSKVKRLGLVYNETYNEWMCSELVEYRGVL